MFPLNHYTVLLLFLASWVYLSWIFTEVLVKKTVATLIKIFP